MNSNQVLSILGVSLLLLLAGCSGIPGFDSKSTPTTTPTPDKNTINYPFGWNESGLQRHATKESNPILTESSLTFKFTRTVSLASSQNGDYKVKSKTRQLHQVSALQKRWFIQVSRQKSLSEYYYESGTEYIRTAVLYNNGSIRSQTFTTEPRQFKKVNAYQVKGPEMMILTTNWDTPTVVQYRGNKSLKYEAHGANKILDGNPVYNLGETSKINDYHAVLYVNKKTGNIQKLNVTVGGLRGSDAFRAEFTFTYSNFSQTTVERPPWFEKATNNSSTV